MDNLFEILVPLLFAAIYFIGNFFSGKSEDESAPGGSKSSPQGGEDPEAIERLRRIQEEIRRKIMERRNGAEEGRPEPARDRGNAGREVQTSAPSSGDRSLPERRVVTEQRHLAEERSRREVPAPASRAPGPATDSYSSQMQERLRRIEATNRQAEKLQKQAKVRTQEITDQIGRTRPAAPVLTRPRFGGSVRTTLRNPAAARTAFIYSEVLGPPASQREASTVPGLLR